MEETNQRIKISVGGVSLEAELKSTRTAKEIYAALPIETSVNMWGEEFSPESKIIVKPPPLR